VVEPHEERYAVLLLRRQTSTQVSSRLFRSLRLRLSRRRKHEGRADLSPIYDVYYQCFRTVFECFILDMSQFYFIVSVFNFALTENDGHEIDGHDKLTDQVSRHEIDGPSVQA